MSTLKNPIPVVALLFAGAVAIALCGCSAYIPTGSDSETKVVAIRSDGDGKTSEAIVEETVRSGRFYPATVEGPFVSSNAIGAFRYSLRAAGGKERRLNFLERHEIYERFREFCPLSGGRWVGISGIEGTMADFVEDAQRLEVVIFDASHALFRRKIIGCYYNLGPPMPGSRKPPEWRPLKEGMKLYQLNYIIDTARELAVLRTYKGDLVFSFKDGSLRPETPSP